MNYRNLFLWVTRIVIAVIFVVTFTACTDSDVHNSSENEVIKDESLLVQNQPFEEDDYVKYSDEDTQEFRQIVIPHPDGEFLTLGGDYIAPDFVSAYEFEWGEYLPILKFDTESMVDKYVYAVITPQSKELDDAINAYYLYENSGNNIFDVAEFSEQTLVQAVPPEHLAEHVCSYVANDGYTLETGANEDAFNVLSADGELLYSVIKEPRDSAEYGDIYLTVEQLIDGRYLVINAVYDARKGYYLYENHAVQLFDLETQEYTYLVGDSRDAILSPDGKYLAYSLPTVDENFNNGHWDYSKNKGFYILNIESGKTLYYECPGNKNRFINWISCEEYEKIVPDENVKADLDEAATIFLDKHIYLDSKGTDTKEIFIGFPEDFQYGPYTEDNIVPSSEFDWGGWALLGNHRVGSFTVSDDIYDYVIMSERTATMDDAIALYQAYNDKYLIKTPITSNDDLSPQEVEFLYDSRIVGISEDGSEVVRRTRSNNSPLGGYTDWYAQWYNGMWTDNYELIKDGASRDYVSIPATLYDYSSFESVLSAKDTEENGYEYKYYKEPTEYSDFWSRTFDNFVVLISNEKLLIYSSETKKMLYEITLPYEVEGGKIKSIDLDDIIDSRYLLFCVSYSAEDSYYDTNFSYYRYDLHTEEMLFLARYASAYAYCFSPDGKYIAYTSPMGYDYDLDWIKNNLEAMKPGFYIRNLENGEIVAFHDSHYWQGIVGFVNADSVHKTVDSDVSYVDPSIEQRQDVSFTPKDSETVSHSLNTSQSLGCVEVDEVRVSNTEFDWGEYVPFVRYLENEKDSYYTRAFLYSKAEHMDDALALYQRLMAKENGACVTYVSDEADKVGIIEFTSDDDGKYFEYKVIGNGETLFYQKTNASIPESPFYDYSKESFAPYVLYIPPEDCYWITDHSDDEYKLFYNTEYTKLFVFSVSTGRMLYELVLPSDGDRYVTVEDFSGGRYLLIRTLTGDRIAYDLQNGSYVTIKGMGNYPEISPDGRYVLSVADGYGGENEDALHGFYICDLQTNETVYYHAVTDATKYYQYGNFINWVNEEKLLRLINS